MSRILLSHGAGGREMAALIDEVFLARYGDPNRVGDDSATVLLGSHRLAFTTDSFVVDPLFFPGGDIGRLAVAGTVNDLLTAAARPLVLSASFILEEGLEIAVLQAIAESMREAAAEAGVAIVTGDTKVVPKGSADKVFITTAGVGLVLAPGVSGAAARPGDEIILTGTVGDHGAAVLLAREKLLDGEAIRSDAAPLTGLVLNLLEEGCRNSRHAGPHPGRHRLGLERNRPPVPGRHGNHRGPGAGGARRWPRPARPWAWTSSRWPTKARCSSSWPRRMPPKPCSSSGAAPTARRPGSSAR